MKTGNRSSLHIKFGFLCSLSQNKPFSIIGNPVSSKSSKGFNSILKNQTKKPLDQIKDVVKTKVPQETQIPNLFARRESLDVRG